MLKNRGVIMFYIFVFYFDYFLSKINLIFVEILCVFLNKKNVLKCDKVIICYKYFIGL